MLHPSRRFAVVDATGIEDLLEKLLEHTWCGCAGFRLGSLLFLNDSTGADGAQEYAVVHEPTMTQVESLTVSWMTHATLRAWLEARDDLLTGEAYADCSSVKIEAAAAHGTCWLCR